jgi:HK97 family phage major capsid protein
MAINELKQKRAKLWHDMQTLDAKVSGENRDFSPEEREQWDKMDVDLTRMTDEITRKEKLLAERDKRAAEQDTQTDDTRDFKPDPGRVEERAKEEDEKYKTAFRTWILGGPEALTPEQRSLMASRFVAGSELRAQGVATGAAGGYTVPEGFYNRLTEAMKWYGGIRDSRATILTTASGSDLPMPTDNDTTNKGARVGENTQVTEQDVAFGQKTLKAYMYTSKVVRVSFQLLQDSAFDIEAYLARKLGERIGRITNEEFTTGTGSAGSMPQGVVTGALQGKVGATGQTTSVTYEDLVDLEHSVDKAYRRAAEFMLHDTTLAVLKKLKDGDGRPMWIPGMATREPDTILGYRYVINNDMPAMAAGAKSILFGDFSLFHVRDVVGAQLLRLTERYADFLQVGFLAFSRHDSVLLDAGTGPIKYYQNSAT